MALADTAHLVVQLKLDDKLSGGLGRVNASLSRLQAGAGQVGKGVGQIGAGLARIGTIAATGFALGVGAAVKMAGDFEAQLNVINTIALETPEALNGIGDGIRKLARETGADLGDLTSGYYDLLSAGIKVADAQNLLNQSYRLGRGALGSTSEAVDVLTTAINSYQTSSLYAGKSTSDLATIFSDQLAQAVADGKLKLTDIAGSFADIAPIAANAGIGLDQIAASYGLITARGSAAAEVATQMSRAIIELIKPSTDLTALQDKLGINFAKVAREKGLVVAIQQIREAATKSNIPFESLFGRLEGLRYVITTSGVNFDAYAGELDKIRGSAGALDKQVAARNQGLNFQLGILSQNFKDAGITIGTALLPKLTPLVTQLTKFLTEHQGDIARFGQNLADGFGKFYDRIKTIDFTPLIDALKTMRDVGKAVVDAFLRLPPNIQGLLVTGFALNKLSGGLLAKGVGNIGGGLLKIGFEYFGARGSSPTNPVWTASATGGGGVPVAGGIGLVIRSLLGVTSAIVLGEYIGQAIGKSAFYEPTVKPARQYEQHQIDLIAETDSRKRITDAISKLDLGIADLRRTQLIPPLGPLGGLNPAAGQVADEITLLEGQKAALEAQLVALDRIDSSIRGLPHGHGPGVNRPRAGADIAQGYGPGVNRPLLKLDDAALIAALAKTTEIGVVGIGNKIEHGSLTGIDPYGEQHLALFRQAEFPKQGKTLGEIQRHIIAAEEVQKEYLQKGDINSATRTQAVIDGLHALLGTTDKTRPILERSASLQQRMIDHQTELQFGIDRIANKNFSPTIINNNTVNARLSVTEALQTITISNSIRYDGKTVPL